MSDQPGTPKRRILVTGASSGIGASLAQKLAMPSVSLELWGRSVERLKTVADTVTSAGAQASVRSLNLAYLQDLQAGMAHLAQMPAFDEIYLAAGMSDIIQQDQILEDPTAADNVVQVNYAAVVSIATALAPAMADRGSGRVAIIGSHAGFSAMPYSPVYSSSKAAVSLYARSLDQRLRPMGVTVTLVSAGFVDTPMSRRLDCPKPFMVSPDYAAEHIISACRKGRAHLVLSKPLYLATRLGNLLPMPVQRFIYGRVNVVQVPRSV